MQAEARERSTWTTRAIARGILGQAAVALLLCSACGQGGGSGTRASQPQPGRLAAEFEDGTLHGTEVATAIPGYSGSGYVTGFDAEGDSVEVAVSIPADGVYEVRIRYNSPFGNKGYDLWVAGEAMGGMFAGTGKEEWRDTSAGKAVLRAGPCTVKLGKGWGWFSVDSVSLAPAQVTAPEPPSAGLCDPDASAEARRLYDWLKSIYGKKTIAGQQMDTQAELDWIQEASGKQPALRGYDLIDYSPSRREHGADPGDLAEQAVEWSRAGLVTLSWHWNAPTGLSDTPGKEWWRGFYTDSTTFDLAQALADPNSEGYRLLLRDIDAIAVELRKFADAGRPVLWRPLHEAAGGWFWWGAKGPQPFCQLWRLLHDRLTSHHGLHNLIWIISNGPSDPAWFPGDDVVDIVGLDQYKSGGGTAAASSGEWDALQAAFAGKHMLAMTENGSIPDPARMEALETRWLWFCTWGGYVRQGKWNTRDSLAAAFEHADVITLDELASEGWRP